MLPLPLLLVSFDVLLEELDANPPLLVLGRPEEDDGDGGSRDEYAADWTFINFFELVDGRSV